MAAAVVAVRPCYMARVEAWWQLLLLLLRRWLPIELILLLTIVIHVWRAHTLITSIGVHRKVLIVVVHFSPTGGITVAVSRPVTMIGGAMGGDCHDKRDPFHGNDPGCCCSDESWKTCRHACID